MHASVRIYRNLRDFDEVARRVETGLVPILTRIPGFCAYYAVRCGETAAPSTLGFDQRGSGFGPVAVTRRWGTQSSTWWKPSNVLPWSSTTSRSARRWNFTWVKSSNRM